MDDNKKQAVALMRYSAISPAITGALDNYSSLNAYFRDVSARGIKAPDGSIRHYAVTTMEKWYAAYKKHDIFWNTERISMFLNKTDAVTIATGIYEYWNS